MAELRRESGSIQDALDALKQGTTARSRRGEALDPLHAVYVAVQNVTSVFAERVSVSPSSSPITGSSSTPRRTTCRAARR